MEHSGTGGTQVGELRGEQDQMTSRVPFPPPEHDTRKDEKPCSKFSNSLSFNNLTGRTNTCAILKNFKTAQRNFPMSIAFNI